MNVQHLESLNDVVSGITGIRVWETVPDRVFDEADEVVIVDLPPDDLLQRLKEGKVYLPQQAGHGGAQLLPQGQPASRCASWRCAAPPTASTTRCCSTGAPWRWRRCGRRARRCCCASAPTSAPRSWCAPRARLAAQLDVPWHCVYVETPRLQRLPDSGAPAGAAGAQAGAGGRRRHRDARRQNRWPARSSSTRTSTTCRAWCSGRDTGRAAAAVAPHAGRGGGRSSATTST